MSPPLKTKGKRRRKNKKNSVGGVRRYWTLIVWPLALISLLIVQTFLEKIPLDRALETLEKQYQSEISSLQREIGQLEVQFSKTP